MKKKIGLLFMMLLMLVAVPVGAKTQKGFYADNNLTVSDDQESTVFAAGNFVNVTSKIDGLAFIAGNQVTVQSEQDYLFTAGNMVNLKGVVAKDAFAAGTTITIDESTIRDLYAAAETITINSDVTRNAFLGGTRVEINSTISGNAEVACSELVLGENAKILGTLNIPEETKLEKAEGAQVETITKYKSNVDIDGKEIAEKTAVAVIIAYIVSFIVSLISKVAVGVIFMFLFKKVFDRIDEEEKAAGNFFAKLGIGFGTLCLTPILAVMLLITGVLLPVGIMMALIYGILIYLSVIPTSYYVGRWIFKDKIKNDYLLYIVSVVILLILFRIPILGGLSKFASLCVGLGLFTTIIYHSMTLGKEEKTKKK